MFQSARLKLTAWYLLIIMIITLFFSGVIYTFVDRDLMRFERIQRVRTAVDTDGNLIVQRAAPPSLDPDMIHEARVRLLVVLLALNASIITLAGVAGYFLAGRTLKPIAQMLEDQNQFISDASHELRTPLTALRSELEVNIRDQKMSLPQAKKLLESNLEEVMSLQTLSDSLLELIQYRKPFQTYPAKPQELAEVLQDAYKKVLPLAKQKQIELQLPETKSIITGDRMRLTELFVILLDNAIKYSPEKTVISFRVKEGRDGVSILVEDQGDGIEQSELPHIFDRFYRGDRSRSKGDVDGYGLGLAIAKKIVLEHNGSISVASTVGKGTTFTVRLPA